MPRLTTAAWIAHDLGLAASIGGVLFGRTALDPALRLIEDPSERDAVNDAAWSRYGKVTLASHVAIAAPWVVGRFMRSGREVSSTARSLTRTKDILVGVSFVSCIASAILGSMVSKRRSSRDVGPEEARARGSNGHGDGEKQRKVAIDRTLDVVSLINTAANVGIAGVTTALAMEGSQSPTFSLSSRRLP
jgi:hypothetical protein